MSGTVTLATSDNIFGTGGKQFNYADTLSGSKLLTEVCKNLEMAEAKNLRLLLRINKDTCVWVSPTETLATYKPTNGMSLYILRTNTTIDLYFPDGSNKKILIDITKTVEELVQYISDKIRTSALISSSNVNNSIGYSLFEIDKDGAHIPLDLNQTLPQQCEHYEKLFIERRHFVFTKAQLNSKALSAVIFNEVVPNMDGKWHLSNMTLEQQAELLYYKLYSSVTTSPDEVKQSSIPQNTAPNVKNLVISYLETRTPPRSKEDSINQYLTIASQINGFGCETYNVKWSLNNSAAQNGVLIASPQKADIIVNGTSVATSFSYTILKSSTVNQNNVIIKFVSDENKSESILNLLCENPTAARSLHTLVNGYSILYREYSSELTVNGYSKEATQTTSDAEILKGIKFSTFSNYYSYNSNSNKNVYYPGTPTQFLRVFEPALANIKAINPAIAADMERNIQIIKVDPVNQEAILHLIFNVESLSTKDQSTIMITGTNPYANFNQIIDQNSIEYGLFTLSTINITVGGLEALLSDSISLLSCQKIIRNEILLRVDITWKNQIEQIVKSLKAYKDFLADSINSMRQNPTDGTLLYQIQCKLIEMDLYMNNLTQFVESFTKFSPGTPYYAAIDKFKKHVREILRPLIPREPKDRTIHIVKLYNLMLATSIVLAIGNELKEDQNIVNNADLSHKLTDVLSNLVVSYSKIQESKKNLTIRPLSILFLKDVKNDLFELRRDLASLKAVAEMVEAFSNNSLFLKSVVYSIAILDSTTYIMDNLRTEPFRDMPTQQQLKQLHDLIFESLQKFLKYSSNLKDQRSKDLFNNINETVTVLKNLLQFLKQDIQSPSKGIFGIVMRTRQSLINVLHMIRELSSLLSDTSLYHSFTKILTSFDEILVIKTPNYRNLGTFLNDMMSAVQAELGQITNQQAMNECLKIMSTSNYPAREIATLRTMKNIIAPQLNDTSNPDKTLRLKKAFDSIHSLINCINQLPASTVYQIPRINFVPFFKGKEIKAMIQEIIPQVHTFTKIFNAIKSTPFFGSQKKYSTVIDFWELYFNDCTVKIPQLKDDYIVLLAKLREILKKKVQIAIFCSTISMHISEFDLFNNQVNTFFGNIDILVQALSKPIVHSEDTQSFIDLILPKLLILQTLFLNIESPSSNLNEKLRQLQQQLTTSSNLRQMNAGQLQQFADGLYPLVHDILAIDKNQKSLSPSFTAASMDLLNSLAPFTELSIKLPANIKVYPSIVPSIAIQQLCTELINGISVNLSNGIQPQQMAQLELLFGKYTADSQSLPPALASASLFIKSQTVKFYPYDALRVLICAQTNKKYILEQLKNMTIMFSVAAAQLVTSVLSFVEEIKNKPPTQKALYYATYLFRAIEGFDPKILVDSKTFQSVAFTYASLRDIRASLSLLLTESASLNQTLGQYANNFLTAIDQADTSLALLFAHSVEGVLSECLSLYTSSNNEEKAKTLNALIDYINNPSLQIGPNYVHISKLAAELPLLEKDLDTSESFSKDDPYVRDLLNHFNPLKEFKLITHYWCNPTSESDNISFWMNTFSDLTLSQVPLSTINSIYTKDILKVPLIFVRPSSLLTSLQILCQNCQDEQSKSLVSIDKVSTMADEILNQYILLGSDAKGYKGDLKMQELLPQFFLLFDSLVKEVMSLKEPNYQNLPSSDKLLGVTSAKQIRMILAQAEHTPIYDETKEIADYMNSQNNASINAAIASTFATTLNLLPSFIDLPMKDTVQNLKESLNKVFKQLTSQDAALDQLLTEFPNLLASMVKYLSTLNEKARKILDIRAVYFLKSLQKLPTIQGNEFAYQKALIQNQLVQLSYFMNLRNQILKNEDIEKNSTKETMNLITSLSNNERNKIMVTLMNLKAYRTLAADRELNVDLLNDIDEVLTVLNENQQTNKLTPQQIGEQRDKLLVSLSNDTIKIVKAISSKTDLDSLIDLRADMNLIAQLTSDSKESAQPSIRSLISIASEVELLAHRGLELTPNMPSSFVFDYVDNYFMSFQALNKFIEKKDKSDLRMFRRFVDNTGDLVDDMSLDAATFEEQLGFSGAKAKFVMACAHVLSSISKLNVSFSNSTINNTFSIVLNQEVPKITERANYLINNAKTMIDTNTLKEINTQFITATNSFHSQISSIVANLSKSDENSIIKFELPLIESIHSLASLANSMNDEVPIYYEPEQANKLPQKFVLPTVDSTSPTNVKPQDLARNALSIIKLVNVTEYTNYMATLPRNAPLVETTLKFYDQLKTVLSSCLLVSHRSVNLQNKLDLIDNSNALVASINALNKGVRSKCLCSPTWLRDCQRSLKDITEKLNGFAPLCQAAITSADAEEKSIDQMSSQIYPVLATLNEKIGDLDKIVDIISKNAPVTPAREYSITLCALASKGASVLSNLLLYAKDHPKEFNDLEGCLEKANQMIAFIGKLETTFGYDRNNKDNSNLNIASIETLAQLNHDVSNILIGISDQLVDVNNEEALKLKEQLKIISRGIETLGVSITQSPEYSAKGQSKFNSPEAQQRLMTRLELESNVIRYRYKLDFLENVMTKFG